MTLQLIQKHTREWIDDYNYVVVGDGHLSLTHLWGAARKKSLTGVCRFGKASDIDAAYKKLKAHLVRCKKDSDGDDDRVAPITL